MTAAVVTGRWLELVVSCDPQAVEVVAALFADHGLNEGVVIEEPMTPATDNGCVQPDPTRPVTVSTYLDGAGSEETEETVDHIRQRLADLRPLHDISDLVIRNVAITKREDQDWADAWLASARIHRVGRRVVVKAPWHHYDPSPDEIVLDLDIGTAFGGGGHPTTHLVMVALDDEVAPGARVLDVGTGTGILAIVAARLGARAVDAVDIEPASIQIARENALRNGVGDVVRIERGSVGPDAPFQGEYDLVIANILARVLIELAPSLAKAVRAGGTLILSGIIDFREASVCETFEALGLSSIRRDELEGWVTLVWRKPGADTPPALSVDADHGDAAALGGFP